MESTPSAGRRIVVDGSNIATEGRATPSLAQLDEAIRAFLDEHPGFTTADVTVVVDATFGHRIDPSEVGAFEQAVEHGEMVTPPAGAVGRGDGFILRIADKASALVLSNDSFQEFHSERPWLFEPGRLIGGKPVPGVGWVFTPRTPVRGAVSRAVTTRSKRTPESADATFRLAGGLEPEQVADRKVVGGEVTRSAKDTASPTETLGKTSAGRAKASKARKPAKSTPTPATDLAIKSTKGAKATGAAKTAKTAKSTKGAKAAGAAKGTKGAKATRVSLSVPEHPGATLDGGDPPVGPRRDGQAQNDALTFLTFVAEHPVGSTFEGTVKAFTSHGAHVDVGGMLCHVPLRNLGSPPPTRARQVLAKGETRPFVLISLDAPRRRASLALPGVEG